jgi:hypothetical protein
MSVPAVYFRKLVLDRGLFISEVLYQKNNFLYPVNYASHTARWFLKSFYTYISKRSTEK